MNLFHGRPPKSIEAQIASERYQELGFKEGDTLVVSPRKARVFLTPETATA